MSTECLFSGNRHISSRRREALLQCKRSFVMLEASDAARIARGLTEKYGTDALAHAQDRAQCAIEVGDELALEAWQSVIEAMRDLLQQMADA
jgi:hypothetical protein